MSLVGILGAGQLGSYLCQSARHLGHSTIVVSPDSDAPAAAHADQLIFGQLTPDTTARVIAQADVITFEREDVPTETLDLLIKARDEGRCRVYPSPETLLMIQDKATQKRWLQCNNFPTVKHLECDGTESVESIAAQIGLPFVQKARTGGFDGRGVQVIESVEDALWPCLSIAESFVNRSMELSVLVSRHEHNHEHNHGDAVYPVVEQVFDASAHILQHAISPARIPEAVARSAQALAINIVRAIDSVGLVAVELFLTVDQQLLVNEISPRVHNSGHLTLEASETSQFEQHLLAITGSEPGGTRQTSPSAAMANILFQPSLREACKAQQGKVSIDQDTSIHWYGKRGEQPMRKMGHVTATGSRPEDALARIDKALAGLKGRQ